MRRLMRPLVLVTSVATLFLLPAYAQESEQDQLDPDGLLGTLMALEDLEDQASSSPAIRALNMSIAITDNNVASLRAEIEATDRMVLTLAAAFAYTFGLLLFGVAAYTVRIHVKLAEVKGRLDAFTISQSDMD